MDLVDYVTSLTHIDPSFGDISRDQEAEGALQLDQVKYPLQAYGTRQSRAEALFKHAFEVRVQFGPSYCPRAN